MKSFIRNLLGGSEMAKKKPEKKCQEVKLTKAEEISKQYNELSKCCSVIASVGAVDDDGIFDMYGRKNGWRLWASDLKSAGIDIEEVYAHIRRLANKRRLDLECDLLRLED